MVGIAAAKIKWQIIETQTKFDSSLISQAQKEIISLDEIIKTDNQKFSKTLNMINSIYNKQWSPYNHIAREYLRSKISVQLYYKGMNVYRSFLSLQQPGLKGWQS